MPSACLKLGLPLYRIAYGVNERRAGVHTPLCAPQWNSLFLLFMSAEYVVTDSFHGTAFFDESIEEVCFD